jgi:hypothetical protein
MLLLWYDDVELKTAALCENGVCASFCNTLRVLPLVLGIHTKTLAGLGETAQQNMAFSRRCAVVPCLAVSVLVLVAISLLPTGASALRKPPVSQLTCPKFWSHRKTDDRCYRLFPSERSNATFRTPLNYDEAAEYCRIVHNAELPMAYNRTTADYLLDLIGRKSGVAIWLAVRHDRRSRRTSGDPNFIFPDSKRPYPFKTSFWDWDKSRGAPDGEECLALHARGDKSKRILGGNNKMVTVNCFNQLRVVCVKDRYPARINAVNGTTTGVVKATWRKPLWLEINGLYIPPGTRVSLQTTSEAYFPAGPGQPTNCTDVPHTTGGSYPLILTNVTVNRKYPQKLCNGTCDSAVVNVPLSMPFVRGARYSLCFFVPAFDKPTPLVSAEYARNLIPGVTVEWVQRRAEFLEDTCKRHKHSVDLFFGDRRTDTNRDKVNPYYFTSGVSPS